jgi:hypothetical protein
MAHLLAQFAHADSLGLAKLQKMTHFSLKTLLAEGQLHNSFYFDKSTVKNFSQSLKQTGLAKVQGGSIQLENVDALNFFYPSDETAALALIQATTFSEKELKDFESKAKS